MKPILIINHHSLTKDSGSVSWGAIRKWHMGLIGGEDNYYTNHPMIDIGYHFGLEMIGDHCEVLIGRMMNEQGAHTRSHNRNSIGICWIGNYDLSEVPPEMWRMGVRLEASLCELLNIEPSKIYGHNQFNKSKSCPGKKFSILGLQENVRELLNK